MTERLQWLDALKGAAIVMIVIHHTIIFLEPLGLVDPAWLLAREAMAAFPLALFFTVSGYLSRSALDGSWSLLWERRLLPLLWLYLVWTLVRFLWFWLVPLPTRPLETDLVRLLVSPLWPTSGIWYLHALALALVAAKLALGKIPVPLQLLVTGAVSVAFFGPLDTGSVGYEGLAHYLVFFLLGLHAGPTLVRAVRYSTPLHAVLAAGLFVAGLVLVRALVLQGAPGIPILLSLLAVATGALVLRHLSALTHTVRLDVLGRLSLPVYVMHTVVIAAATSALLLLTGGAQDVPRLARVLLLPAVVALAVGASVVVATVLLRTPLRPLVHLAQRRPVA